MLDPKKMKLLEDQVEDLTKDSKRIISDLDRLLHGIGLLPINVTKLPNACFVEPLVEQVYVPHFGIQKNNPVNINLCTELVKQDIQTRDYSKKEEDQEVVYPIIELKGCNAKWYFEVGDFKARDEQYEALLSINKPIPLK